MYECVFLCAHVPFDARAVFCMCTRVQRYGCVIVARYSRVPCVSACSAVLRASVCTGVTALATAHLCTHGDALVRQYGVFWGACLLPMMIMMMKTTTTTTSAMIDNLSRDFEIYVWRRE